MEKLTREASQYQLMNFKIAHEVLIKTDIDKTIENMVTVHKRLIIPKDVIREFMPASAETGGISSCLVTRLIFPG